MASGTELDGGVVRRRIAAWVKWYIDEKGREDVEITRRELEARLGVGAGTGTRILQGDRLGLDVFLAIRRLLRKSADTLLDENPPGWKP